MLGKTEPKSSISSLVMIAADVNVKPGILIAIGGKEGKAEELLLVVQRPLSSTGGCAPVLQPFRCTWQGVMGCFQHTATSTRQRPAGVWLSSRMREGMEGAPSQPQKELKVKP